MGFIDIHCHILNGIDDGAKTIEETIEMLRIAANDGIKKIVATPHNISGVSNFDDIKLMGKVDHLNSVLKEQGIDVVIYKGCEVFIDYNNIKDWEDGKISSLNNSRYILIELPMTDYQSYTDEIIYSMQLKGLKPIIAHPERYPSVLKNPNLLYDLVRKGVLSQLNTLSITGESGREVKELSEKLLLNNLVHFVATDAHSTGVRKPVLSKGYNRVVELIGREKAERIFFDNPIRLLQDKEIEIQEPSQIILEKKGFMGIIKKYFNTITK